MIRCEGVGIACQSFSKVANSFGGDQQYSLLSVMVVEWLTAALLLIVFMKATSDESRDDTAALIIGLSVTMLHLIVMPISNSGLNPASATGAAVFAGGSALTQLWVFWVAPIIGAVTGALIGRWLFDEPSSLQ